MNFNKLYHGSALDAAEELDAAGGSVDVSDLSAALVNALRQIAELQRQASKLRVTADMEKP